MPYIYSHKTIFVMKKAVENSIEFVNRDHNGDKRVRLLHLILCILDNVELNHIEISGIIHCIQIEVDKTITDAPNCGTNPN